MTGKKQLNLMRDDTDLLRRELRRKRRESAPSESPIARLVRWPDSGWLADPAGKADR